MAMAMAGREVASHGAAMAPSRVARLGVAVAMCFGWRVCRRGCVIRAWVGAAGVS